MSAYDFIREFLTGRDLTTYSLPFFVQVVTQTNRVVPVWAIELVPNPQAFSSDVKTLPRLVVPGEDGTQVSLAAGEIDANQFKLVADALAYYSTNFNQDNQYPGKVGHLVALAVGHRLYQNFAHDRRSVINREIVKWARQYVRDHYDPEDMQTDVTHYDVRQLLEKLWSEPIAG